MAKKTARKASNPGKKPSPTASPGKKTPTTAPGASVDPAARPVRRENRHRWTFLTNHSHVLILLHADPDLVLREIAAKVGITERAIQQILHDLEEEGFIEREKVGRQNHYRVMTDQALRHPIESHCSISDLLSLIVDHPRSSANEWL